MLVSCRFSLGAERGRLGFLGPLCPVTLPSSLLLVSGARAEGLDPEFSVRAPGRSGPGCAQVSWRRGCPCRKENKGRFRGSQSRGPKAAWALGARSLRSRSTPGSVFPLPQCPTWGWERHAARRGARTAPLVTSGLYPGQERSPQGGGRMKVRALAGAPWFGLWHPPSPAVPARPPQGPRPRCSWGSGTAVQGAPMILWGVVPLGDCPRVH